MKYRILYGEGGKGGGSAFFENDNTLKSNTIVSTLEGIGLGPIVGLVNGNKSVYLNDTPLQNEDNTDNYKNVTAELKTGTPSQAVIRGFEEVSAPVSVATTLTYSAPVTRTVSAAAIDAVGITLRLPNGISNQNAETNQLEKTQLSVKFQVKLTSSGTWIDAFTVNIDDKITSDYQETFRVERPSGTTLWEWRAVRLTADSTAATLRNATQIAYFTEYNAETVTYPDVALLGIHLDASGVNATQIPIRAAEVYGRIVQVPTNMDVSARTFSGTWDGTFKNDWTNDPAWVIYDIVTLDKPVGLGLTEDQIDLISFYKASQYNSGDISYLDENGVTQTGKRCSFNYQISEGEDPASLLNKIASSMYAKLAWMNGKLTLIQDRPAESVDHIFTEADVVSGEFVESSSDLATRYTVVNVTWIDPAAGYKPAVSTVEASSTFTDIFGYKTTNIVHYGCTSKVQSIRYGKHFLDTSLYTTGIVKFTVGMRGAIVVPGQLIKYYSDTNSGQPASGRLIAGSTTTVLNLDRVVDISASATIDIIDQNGTLHQNKTILTTGLTDTITLDSALTLAPSEFSTFLITTNSIEPKQARVMSVKEVERGKYEITAGIYDPNKYTRIETGIEVPPPVYTRIDLNTVAPPSNLVVSERTFFDGAILKRLVSATWDPPAQVQNVTGYRVSWTLNGGNPGSVDIKTNSIESEVSPGELFVMVQSIAANGNLSIPISTYFTVNGTEASGSLLSPVTGLYVKGTTSTTFEQPDLFIEFTNPTANGEESVSTFKFKVEIYDGATLKRTEYLDAVPPGNKQYYTYTRAMNAADGLDKRSFDVKVYVLDGTQKLSTATTATFTNAAPATPSNLVLSQTPQGITISYDPNTEADLVGYSYWASTTSGFTPGTGNFIGTTSSTYTAYTDLPEDTTYYVRVAAYDSFHSDPSSPTDLNLTTESSVTTLDYASINTGYAVAYKRSATLPTDNPGDVTFTYGSGITTPATDALANGWYKTPPASDGNPLYIIGATGGGTGTTDTILAAEWDTPRLMVNDGIDGINYATAFLYQRTSSSTPPTVGGTSPTNDLTYTFSTGLLSGTPPSGWSTTIPSSGGGYLWRVQALTSADVGVTTDVIAPGNWSSAYLFATDGIGGYTYTITAPGAILQPVDNGTFSPTTLSISSSRSIGSDTPSSYAGRFIIATSTNGTSFSDQYTSASDESSKVWTITPATANYVRVRLYEAGGTTSLLDEEVIPVVNTGNNAITVVVRNDTVSLPADSSGTVSSYSNSGVVIEVYEGSQQMTYNSSLGVGVPGKFTIGTPTVVAGTVTVPSPTYSGTGTTAATTGNLSAMSTDTAQIRWPITVWRFDKAVGDYDAGTYYAYQNVAKAKQGTTGSTGATGATGTTGASARVAYALYAGGTASPVGGSDVVRTGDGLTTGLPLTTSWSTTAATSFTASPQTPGSGQQLMASFGLYDPATGNVTWKQPILDNFKVNQLSAITADLGSITAGTVTGATIRTASSGARVELSGNTLKATNSSGNNLIEFDYTGKVLFTGGVYDPTGGSNYGAAVARVGTSTNTSAVVGFYGYNEKSSGGQAIKGESTSGNSSGVGVYGLANHSSSTGVYAYNSANGQALLVAGKAVMNLFNSGSSTGSELALTHTDNHIRLHNNVPGDGTGYGSIIGNNGTDFKIGTTASGSADSGAISTTPFKITLSSGMVTLTGLTLGSGNTVSTGSATATFTGTNKPGSNSSNTWLTIVINGTTYYIPAWT